MTAYDDYTAPDPGQPALRGFFRALLTVAFKGLIRPPTPFKVQRALLRTLTGVTLMPRGVRVTDGVLAARPCKWFSDQADVQRVILYLHGGAFIIGAPYTHRALCASLAKRSGYRVCALAYRLAPEHPFPAAQDDVVTAYQDLLSQGVAPSDIVLAGDSAGGNLVLGACLRLRAMQLPLPRALVCFSPVTDLTAERLHAPAAGDPMIARTWLAQARALYLKDGQDPACPSVSPLFADLQGLPPVLVQVAEDEVLLNDSLRLAQRVREAGGTVRLERYPGLWHVFQVHAGVLKASDNALERVAQFVSEPPQEATPPN